MRGKDGKVSENQALLGLESCGVWTLFRRENVVPDEFEKLCYPNVIILACLIIHNFIPKHVCSLLVPLLYSDIVFTAESIASMEFSAVLFFFCYILSISAVYCIVLVIFLKGFRVCPRVVVSAVRMFLNSGISCLGLKFRKINRSAKFKMDGQGETLKAETA